MHVIISAIKFDEKSPSLRHYLYPVRRYRRKSKWEEGGGGEGFASTAWIGLTRYIYQVHFKCTFSFLCEPVCCEILAIVDDVKFVSTPGLSF